MDVGVADLASLASPNPVSLVTSSIKIAIKLNGVYSARGGKLAEFAGYMQRVAHALQGMQGRLRDDSAPVLAKLNATLEAAAAKVEKYQKRSAIGAVFRASAENARLQQLTNDINSLLRQLEATAQPGSSGGAAHPGVAAPPGVPLPPGPPAATPWQQLLQTSPVSSCGFAGPSALPGLSGWTQSAALQGQYPAAGGSLAQIAAQAALQRHQSMATLQQITQQAARQRVEAMAHLNELMQQSAQRQQQAMEQLNLQMQAASEQQQASAAAVAHQGLSTHNPAAALQAQAEAQAALQQSLAAMGVAGAGYSCQAAPEFSFAPGM